MKPTQREIEKRIDFLEKSGYEYVRTFGVYQKLLKFQLDAKKETYGMNYTIEETDVMDVPPGKFTEFLRKEEDRTINEMIEQIQQIHRQRVIEIYKEGVK